MLLRKNHNSFGIHVVKEFLWNLVLYFIYFFTLLFWIRFIGVCAQVHRGVIINNQLFDDSSGIEKLHSTNAVHSFNISSSTVKPSLFVSSRYRPSSFGISDPNNLKRTKSLPIEFDSGAVVNHSVAIDDEEIDDESKENNNQYVALEQSINSSDHQNLIPQPLLQRPIKLNDSSSDFHRSEIFEEAAVFPATTLLPNFMIPNSTLANYDNDTTDNQYLESQQISTTESPLYTQTLFHTSDHPTTIDSIATTSATATRAQSVPSSFQGALSEVLENSTYLNDVSDDIDDSHYHDDDEWWSIMPIIDPPAKEHVLEPEHANDLFNIEDILQRNRSDLEKLDELIDKVNKTGALAKVNVLNATSRIDNDIDQLEASASQLDFTYLQPLDTDPNGFRIPYEQPQNDDNFDDPKELKVQFVLDCDLKNNDTPAIPFDSGMQITRPHTKTPTRYPPNMVQSVFNVKRVSSTTRAPPTHPLMYAQLNQVYHAPQQYPYATRPAPLFNNPIRKRYPTNYPPISQTNSMLNFYYPTEAPPYQPHTMFYHPTDIPSPIRSTVNKNAVYYFPTDFPMKPSTIRPSTVRYKIPKPTRTPATAATTKRPIKRPKPKTTTRPLFKDIYVDPPVIDVISDTFDNVYSYFEDALTTDVEVKAKKRAKSSKSFKRKRDKKRPIMKRSTEVNRMPITERIVPIYTPTKQPNYQRYTQSYAAQNGQKLTTNIQVTSEYVGKEPATDRPIIDDSSSASDYGGDYYTDDDYSSDVNGIRDEEDEDDSDTDSDYGISFGIDDYDDEESDEDLYEGPPPNKLHRQNIRRRYERPNRRKPSRKHRPDDEDDDDNDDDDDDDEDDDDDDDDPFSFDGFDMPDVGGFFKNTMNSISDFMPALPFSGDDYDDEEEKKDESKNNDENVSIRRPKFENTLKKIFRQTKYKQRRWFDKFFFSSDEETTTTEEPNEATTERSKILNWLKLTERSVPFHTTSTTTQSWFKNMFLIGSTSTTPSPKDYSIESSTEKVSNSKIILDMLTSQMASAAAKIQASAATKKENNAPKRVTYDDYQIWRIVPSTTGHLEFLQEYKDSDYGENVAWLKGPSLRFSNDVLVPPDMNKEFQEILEDESIPYEVLVWDLEKAIKYENPMMSRRQRLELESEQGHSMTWHRYHNFEDIALYMDYLQVKYPDLVNLIHIGRSFEGRPLMVIKISFDPRELETYTEISLKKHRPVVKTKRKKKVFRPGIFIEAGVHGREWITPATATWIIKELIKHNDTEDGNPEKEILRSVDWYIMPVSNPDGYEYSLNYDRLWHKTRSKLPPNESVFKQALNWLKKDSRFASKTCYGTDPDRNYNINWQNNQSPSTCSDYYEGPKPFSEPETKALAGFLDDNKRLIHMFISLHSYGQFITYPSGANANDLRDMAEVAANAVRDLATEGRYSVDNSHEMHGTGYGSSTEYAMHVSGIKYSYRFELRDTGTQGFLLAPSYIDTTGLETFEMIKAMATYF